MEEPKKSGLEVAIGTAQLVILAYSTASAVKGLYGMSKEGFVIIDGKISEHKRKRRVNRKHLDVVD